MIPNQERIESLLAEYSAMPTQEVRRLAAANQILTADMIINYGCQILSLKIRGEDIREFRSGIGRYAIKVAELKLLPEVVVRFIGEKRLISQFSRMSIRDQEQILGNGYIELISYESGQYTNRRIPLDDLRSGDIAIAFASEGLRSLAQQRSIVEEQQRIAARTKDGVKIEPDPVRNGYIINGFLSCADLLRLGKTRPRKKSVLQ